jgi:hypothetical protein
MLTEHQIAITDPPLHKRLFPLVETPPRARGRLVLSKTPTLPDRLDELLAQLPSGISWAFIIFGKRVQKVVN